MIDNTLRVRFAPSPTGKVHIGNIRTAIFNWLTARHNEGEFLIRVEDTDIERSTQDAIDKLFECLEWLGLDFDSTPIYQTANADKHIQAAKMLLEENKAYYPEAKTPGESLPAIFRIPWDSDNIPAVKISGITELKIHPNETVKISHAGISYAQVSKKGKPVPTSACLAGFHKLKILDDNNNILFNIEENIESILESKEIFKINNGSKFIFERRTVEFQDKVKGILTKPIDSIKDFVILRSDETPIFHIANVIDDVEQQISCIIRGDDHVENTYRHIFLFNALGYDIPSYAHLPMIVNASGKPYSKRDGDAFVGDFKLKGFLPEALFNYLALLGWSSGDDREKYSKDELAQAFQLKRVLSSPARFDIKKLTNLNSKYIAELELIDFIERILDFAEESEKTYVLDWNKADSKKFSLVANLMQSRTKILQEVELWSNFFKEDISYDEKLFKKHITNEFIALLPEIIDQFQNSDLFNTEITEPILRKIEEKNNLKQGFLNRPLRIAITGLQSGPDLIETMNIIGKETVIKRLEKTIESSKNI
jgi:glutamyl-tRNA synthetase